MAGGRGAELPSGRPVFTRRSASISWTEQAYPKLIYFNEVDQGNHFAAWQEPDIFSEEIRAAFRSLR